MKLIIGNKRYSSWSFRPWLVMRQSGIPFEEIRIPLRLSSSQNKILKYSPSGKVPALLDGRIRVWESLAICEYLAEKYPSKHLWPRENKARAFARAISNEMHSGFQNLRQHLPCHFLARYRNFQIPQAAEEDITRILDIWRECRKSFGNQGPFLFGEFSIADAMFAPVVFRFLAYGVKVGKQEQLYMRAIEFLPATQEWVSHASKESERIEAYESFGKR